MTSAGLNSAKPVPEGKLQFNNPPSETLLDLLEILNRGPHGDAGKHSVIRFLEHHGIARSSAQYEEFMRLLDRHLQMGFSRNTISKVPWGGSYDAKGASNQQGDSKRVKVEHDDTTPSHGSRSGSSTRTSQDDSVTSPAGKVMPGSASRSPPRNLKAFSCALGQTILPPFRELAKKPHRWYASRKLDGVRVLALLDFFVPSSPDTRIEFSQAQFVSRQGNPFHSLSKLEEQLRLLENYPTLRPLLDRDPMVIEQRDDGVVKRLVLDGEVCSMVPATHPVRMGDDGTGASALWQNDGFTEDFASAVSMVKRHATMERPMYFVFDVCPWIEVYEGEARGCDGEGLGKTFGERVEDTKGVCEWLRRQVGEKGQGEPRVRALVQWPIELGDVDGMVERAAAEGWEGLIFRADAPYKGKRS